MMASAPIAECAQGRFAGSEAAGILRFAGIAYAKAPVGRLRWRLPEAAEPHAGVREATRFGGACPQAPTPFDRFFGSMMGAQDEDCLHLNIWTPGLSGKRPVMVWIHGGAFMIGAGSQGLYDGAALAGHDVVVVTINYRLGALGFLNLREISGGALGSGGSEGLADQILALEWVKANIAAFGGDPDNVTLFGESAGGMSIGALMSTPAAKGLFHKAIAQSGAAHIGHEPERAVRAGRAFLAALGLEPQDAARARDLPVSALIAAQIAMTAQARAGRNPQRLGQLPFQPSLDGEILAAAPIEAVRQGSAAGIPLMAGTTREEWKLFTGVNPVLRLMSAKSVAARVERVAGEAAPAMLAAYDGASAFEQFNAFMTDKVFAQPCIRLLEAQGAHAPVYAYRCDWKSKLLGGIMGACHAVELGFLFGAYRERLAGAFFGQGADAEALSTAMMRAWTDFAKSGDPGWPAYAPQRRATMILGDGPPHLAEAPEEDRRRAWRPIPDRRLGP